MSLSVSIKKSFPAFTLDVDIEAGNETIGWLGESGCGKSLTMRCIAGIETPDEGKIVVNGKTFFEREAGKRPAVNLSPQERKPLCCSKLYAVPQLNRGRKRSGRNRPKAAQRRT